MAQFSKYFRINKGQNQLDFVDIDTDCDKNLFIDPYIFGVKTDVLSKLCDQYIVNFFETIINCIRSGESDRGRSLMNHLNEPNETCLGLSKGVPSGRGVGGIQADDLFRNLRQSRAAQTGLLSDLAECELFVQGVGPDKISDITTNIIRKHLVQYTQAQCNLHGVEMVPDVPTGWLWNDAEKTWYQDYASLPVINQKKIILVPKAFVRWSLAFSHQSYYNEFVLTYLQAEHLNASSSLVETLRNGRRRVTKKSLKEIHPLSKNFLAEFSEDHPDVLESYKKIMGVSSDILDMELDEKFDESAFCENAIKSLRNIPSGKDDADTYHNFMLGIIEYIFYPHLFYPVKEHDIHDGRKRIDILYSNRSSGGFFFSMLANSRISASTVIVECKNYSSDPGNPELDQVSGRFSPGLGRLGIIVARSFTNRERFIERCKDTYKDGRGLVLPLVDSDIIDMLTAISSKKRSDIDRILHKIFISISS